MMKKLSSLLLLILVSCVSVLSQSSEKLNNLSQSKTASALQELKEFLSIPNDALNAEDIDKNLNWLDTAFKKRGFSTEILLTTRTPLFLAERKFKGAKKTVLFYMHFDGQGIDPSKWNQPNPYKAVLKEKNETGYEIISWDKAKENPNPEWRVFARSSSDDKGPIVMLLSAMDLLDKNLNGKSKINIKVILDGEEEKGSQHLAAAVLKYKEKLQADYLIINDGPMHLSAQPTLVFGCRGITSVVLTTYGPRTPQHSGHYGNYAPNPVFRMAKLLASMKDDDGRVIISGYYDGIEFSEETKKVLQAVPDDTVKMHQIIGIAQSEKVGRYYQESLQYPSLNVRGIQAAWVGAQTRTIVPEKTVASIDIRLVPESDPDRLKALLKKYIEQQGYYVIDRVPTEKERLTHAKILTFEAGKAGMPFRTNIDSEVGKWLEGTMESGLGKAPIKVRIMGGTVPIAPFINALEIPAVIVPLVNADNNQHSPNENLKIWNFTNGIQTFLALMVK